MVCRNPQLKLIALGVGMIAIVFTTAQAQGTVPPYESFPSSGKKIRLERFSPAVPGRYPAVIVLYGAAGMTARGEAFRDYGRRLADNGFVAFLLHYFDATDSATAGDLPVSPAHFQLWTKALQDGITYAAKDTHVDRHRIGLVGFSLGAFLALWEASQDTRIKAVSEYYGGTSMFLGPAKRMPATLILHGERDSFIPVEEAHKLERLLQQQHAPYEIKIYPGQEHGFDGPEGDPAVARDAWQRTLAFLDKYLAAR
jgi:carboxymethylenebutenolidase